MRSQLERGAILVALVGTVAATAWAADRFPLQPESRLWLEGSSTVRDFTCQAQDLQGAVTPAPGAASLAISDLHASVRAGEVTVPVGSLDCGNGTMNDHMRKALKSDAHPAISFKVTEHSVTPASAGKGKVTMKGRLRIAGQERPVTLEATAQEEAGGALRVRGSKEVVMTEFGVKPPSLMMGTMKVKDRVVVHYDVLLRP